LRAQQLVGTDGNHLMKSAAHYPYPCRQCRPALRPEVEWRPSGTHYRL
jgi:hypothetical protein